MKLDEKTKEELKSQYGALAKVTTRDGDEIVVRGPTNPEWRRYTEEKAKDAKKEPTARETLIKSCVVFPDATAAGASFEKYPVLVDKLSNDVLELGMGLEEMRSERL